MVLGFALLLQATVLDPMNDIYEKDYSTGINTSGFDSLSNTIENQNANVEGGDVEQTDDGLSLTYSWKITKGIYSTVVAVISGTIFDTLFTDMLGFHISVAVMARIILWALLIFGIIKLFMKVMP